MWLVTTNDYDTGPAPKATNSDLVFDGDPFVGFRHAYREGALVRIGEGRYRLTPRTGRQLRLTLIYELDHATALPKRLTVRAATAAAPGRRAHRNTTVFTFATYEKLPSTARTRAKLALLSHPGAGPSKVPPAAYFAGLRTGRAPTGASGRGPRALAGHMTRFHVDAAGIRQVRDGVWLMPGRGYVCIAVLVSRAATGGSCVTVAQAAAHGVSVGTSSGGITLVVPDGTRAVRARLPHHPWRTFPIVRSTVHLPGLGYHWTLERG
jgi:hypothetical protein